MHLRAKEESGFGLLELLIAMVMLNVAILALVSAFSSSSIALVRASRIATATTLAHSQMEIYRGAKYANIVFVTSDWTAATADSAYTSDTVYSNYMASPPVPKRLVTDLPTCPTGVPTNGNELKTVTVVVRDPTSLKSYARFTSTFDPSTGT